MVLLPQNSQSRFSFFSPHACAQGLPCHLHEAPLFHCVSKTVKSIITRTERCSALDWAHLLPHSVCFPLPLLLNHALLRELRSSEVLSCFAASFWVEQLMSSLGLHQPLWDIVFPFIQREQLRHFNLCVYLEPEEYSAVLETMCN